MRAFLAACIAIGVLWLLDAEMNDGKYSAVIQRTVKAIL